MYKEFTNQYRLSKTLRFELVPQGDTLRFVKEKGLLQQDEKRAEDYKQAKKLIDEYHKDFIEQVLSDVQLKNLDAYFEIYSTTEKDVKALYKVSEALRKEIAALLK